ncbi:MAG: histidine kinase [Flavobacteriales bacterium]|nr:histidine kinase [Flavobacteriales bacterium]MCB9193469.1 histidine kinase [Flavobacteriales bacterium]
MRSSRLLILLVLLLATGSRTSAQQYGFVQFTTQQGLAQSQVRCIAQDTRGFLWFGTLGGASRFDGKVFVNHALQEDLPDVQVNAVLTTREGEVWLGTGMGLARSRSGMHFERFPLPALSDAPKVMALAEGEGGEIYVATESDGIWRIDHGKPGQLAGLDADHTAGVRALLPAPDGGLLVGMHDGLLRWKPGGADWVSLGDERPKRVSALALGRDRSIWVGTFGEGLFQVHPDGRVTEMDESHGLLQNNVRCVLVDRSDHVWVGTKFGLNRLDKGRVRAYTVHQGMPNDNVWCIFEDNGGDIWVGTDGAGVLRYAGDRFVTFTIKDGLCSDQAMCLVADRSGDLWMGTYGSGVCRMDGMAMISTLDGLPNNTVWCGTVDHAGDLWFGTSDGLCRIRDGFVQQMDAAARLAGQRVLSLWGSPDNTLWCGTRDGVTVLSPDGGIRTFPSDRTGPGRSVRSMVEAPDGSLWLATDQGIARYRNGHFEHWGSKEGVASDAVFCLAIDDNGRTWAGTSNGLTCIRNGRPEIVRFAPDFGSNYVDLLLNDGQGMIWAGTNNGLYHFHPDSLLRDPGSAEHITLGDGLRSLECNLNAALRDASGRCYFGTAAGTVLHDPDREGPWNDRLPPPLLLTGVRSFLQTTDWKGQCDSIGQASGLPIGLQLPYRRNYLTFDYTAISLSDPDQVQYRYRLQDVDQDWLAPTDARFASYSNLPQGRYVFEVSASVHGGPWGPSIKLPFVVLPPFWLSWWFFAIILLAGSISLWGVMRYRSAQRRRHERTRQLMLRSRMLQLEQQALNANMNRHFVFNALNSIQYHINRQDRATANRYLTSFAKLIRKNLDASQSDTTTLAEELERLELYLVLEHMRFKDRFAYTLEVDEGVRSDAVRLPAMMLQPYVENSIWHGILPMERQGHVQITVRPGDAGRVHVRIVDDGIGVVRSKALKNGANGDHISRGIDITKGRADVLRDLHVTDIRITGPEEMVNGDGATIGTVVTIDLPYDHPARSPAGGLQSADPRIIFDER